MRCFARKGFSGTSMSDIVAESTVSTGTVYWYFKSKSELIRESASTVMHDRRIEFEKILRAETLISPAATLKNFLIATRRSLGGSTAMLLQVWGEAIVNPELRELVEEMTRALAGLFLGYLTTWYKRQGMSKSQAERRSVRELPMHIALAQGFIVQCALSPEFQDGPFFNSLQDLLE